MIFYGPLAKTKDIDAFFQCLEKSNLFKKIDLAWGRFVQDYFCLSDIDSIFTVIFLSNLVSNNHICLKLNHWAGKNFPENLSSPLVTFRDKKSWLELISKFSPQLITHTHQIKENYPSLMVVDENQDVYFQKYYHYQKTIAQLLLERSKNKQDRRLHIISGGPGTGKTTQVFQEILQAKKQNPEAQVVLLAPTGKAVARLREAVITAQNKNHHKEIEKISEYFFTVHRFLRKYSSSAERRKKWDLVVVDEASMVSFPWFYELLIAIREVPKLILLGDKDQLSSVEEGSLFYELASGPSPKDSAKNFPLAQHTVYLETNYRYQPNSLIAQAANAIRTDTQKAYSVFKNCLFAEKKSQLDDLIYFSEHTVEDVKKIWKDSFLSNYKNIFSQVLLFQQHEKKSKPDKKIDKDKTGSNRRNEKENKKNEILNSLFELHKNQIILCAQRKGELGVENMNHLVGKWMQEFQVRNKTIFTERYHYLNGHELKVGDPVIVNHNNYDLNIYNGDIGITLPVFQKGIWTLKVFFDNHERGYQGYIPELLESCDLAYALTIHKSQGSEFNKIIVLMGEDKNDYLTREMGYTALTRARKNVFFFMEAEKLIKCLSRTGIRHSGLNSYLIKLGNENFNKI